ncbi:Fc receptor-like protein 5, partial [Silurus asotus]
LYLLIVGTQKAVLSIRPDKQVYKGENVMLKCDIHEGGDTEWRYIWMKDNKVYKNSTTPEIHINSVNNSFTGNFTCRGEKNDSQHLEFSDAVTLNVSEKPVPVLSVSSKNWLTEGDSVTLSCEVKDSFSDWTFSFHKVVPCKVNDSHIQYKLLLLSDSNRGSGSSYTLSHVVLNHTGLYRCRGERGNPAFSTKNSNFKPLWITGETPPVSLIISPNRSQHFTKDSLSLSCEDQSHSSKRWTVRRNMQKIVAKCSQWELSLGSTYNISFLSTSDTGVYWCESETGENINPVNITVH